MNQKESLDITEKINVSYEVPSLDDAARRIERKLRTKIDFCVVPTVTLLYLMYFVDRSNIGGIALPVKLVIRLLMIS